MATTWLIFFGKVEMYGCIAFFVSMPFRNKSNPETSWKTSTKGAREVQKLRDQCENIGRQIKCKQQLGKPSKEHLEERATCSRKLQNCETKPQTLEDTCRKARGNWVTSRLRFFCQRKWMKHCCLQGSLRVWSWSCSSCLRDLRSWRARDWGDKCREQLGEPSKEPILQQKLFATKTPRRWTRQIAPRTLHIFTMAEGSQLTLLKKRPKWTVASSEPLCLSSTSKLCCSDFLLMENCGSSVWSLPFFFRIMQKTLGQTIVSGVLHFEQNVSRS